MIDILLLGLKDIKKNKVVFILMQITILLVVIIFISATMSAVRGLEYNTYDKELENYYEVIPISYDMSSNAKIVEQLYTVIEKHGVSYYASESLTNEMQVQVFIMVGDAGVYNENLHNQQSTQVYATSNFGRDEIQLFGNDYKVSTISEHDTFDIERLGQHREDQYLLIDLNEEVLGSWIDATNGNEFMDLVHNVKFKSEFPTHVAKLQEILDQSSMSLKSMGSRSNEGAFITTYIYPLLFMILLSLCIAFKITYAYFLKKMYKEYTIHFFYGASLLHIVLRSSVMMLLSAILLTSAYTYVVIGAGEIEAIMYFGYGMILMLLLMIEVMIVHQIRKHDFMMNVRGG